VRHGDGLDSLAVHFSVPVPGGRGRSCLLKASVPDAEALVLEIKLDDVLAGRERLGAFPLNTLQVDEVPEEHGFALEQIESVAGKPASRRSGSCLGAAFRDRDVRRNGIGAVSRKGESPCGSPVIGLVYTNSVRRR